MYILLFLITLFTPGYSNQSIPIEVFTNYSSVIYSTDNFGETFSEMNLKNLDQAINQVMSNCHLCVQLYGTHAFQLFKRHSQPHNYFIYHLLWIQTILLDESAVEKTLDKATSTRLQPSSLKMKKRAKQLRLLSGKVLSTECGVGFRSVFISPTYKTLPALKIYSEKSYLILRLLHVHPRLSDNIPDPAFPGPPEHDGPGKVAMAS